MPLTACDGAAVFGLAIARTEPNYHIVGFDDHIYPGVTITARSRLDNAVDEIRELSQNGTPTAPCPSATASSSGSRWLSPDDEGLAASCEGMAQWAGRGRAPGQGAIDHLLLMGGLAAAGPGGGPH